MGFNTVVFLLNDFMHVLEKSPKSVAFALCHPPLSANEDKFIRPQVASVAQEHNEHTPDQQAMHVLPTFHADNLKFFLAGGNQITEVPPVRLGMTKAGKKTITLELPDWFEPWNMFIPKPKTWPKRK